MHSASWDYPKHDFVCDILALPESAHADIILCTEVFEHIPDPIRVFEKSSKILNHDGYLVITVPFCSLMHQVPHWFQAGLSPFWFKYWAEEFGIEIVELTVNGDYKGLMSQEIEKTLFFNRHIKGLAKIGPWFARKYRGRLSQEVPSSGGLGVLFVGRRPL